MSLNVDKNPGGSPLVSNSAVLSLDRRIAHLHVSQGSSDGAVASSAAACASAHGQGSAHGTPGEGAVVVPPTLAQDREAMHDDDVVRDPPRDERRRDDDTRSERLPAMLTAALVDARSAPAMELSLLAATLPVTGTIPAPALPPTLTPPGGHSGGQPRPLPSGSPVAMPLPAHADTPAPPAGPTGQAPSPTPAATLLPASGMPAQSPGQVPQQATQQAPQGSVLPATAEAPTAAASPARAPGQGTHAAAAAAVAPAARSSAGRDPASLRALSVVPGAAALPAGAQPLGDTVPVKPVAGPEPSPAATPREPDAPLPLSNAAKDVAAQQAASTVNAEAGQQRSEASQVTHKRVQQVQQAQKLQEAMATRNKASQIHVALPSFGEGQSIVARQVSGQLTGHWTLHPSSSDVARAINRATAPEGVDLKVVMEGRVSETDSATDAEERRRRQQGREHP